MSKSLSLGLFPPPYNKQIGLDAKLPPRSSSEEMKLLRGRARETLLASTWRLAVLQQLQFRGLSVSTHTYESSLTKSDLSREQLWGS